MTELRGILSRIKFTDKQTLGHLTIFDSLNKVFECCTLELPYLNNETDVSCIYEGVFKAIPYKSPTKGDVYLVENVINRTYVEIHVANYYLQIKGCIAIGKNFVDINKDGYLDVTSSRETMRKFLAIMNNRDIILTIKSI